MCYNIIIIYSKKADEIGWLIAKLRRVELCQRVMLSNYHMTG